MRKQYIIGLALCLTVMHSCTKDYISMEEAQSMQEARNLSIAVSSNTQTDFENELFDLVNAHRVSLGLNELQFESVSYYYAGQHTDYMISQSTLSHDLFATRAENISAKTGATKVSENVANNYETAEEAMDAWLTSPDHRVNLEGDYTHSALRVKEDASGNRYFTQIFAR